MKFEQTMNLNFTKAQYLDVICINRYFGWYHNLGHLDLVEDLVIREISDWSNTYQKPLILSEYGAEAISGLNTVAQFYNHPISN